MTVERDLELDPRRRYLIVHADDIGMCEASVSAYVDLREGGLLSSASTMVPCPWFPAVAAHCRAHEGVDMGVHLTLTSEWQAYRWGPLTAASSLTDADGYFSARSEQLWSRADPAAVRTELRAQIDRARSAGIDVTHLDTHMLSVFTPSLLAIYVELALEHRLPALLWRASARPWFAADVDPERALTWEPQLRERGLPILAQALTMPLQHAGDRLPVLERVLERAPVGITQLTIHPARDTPELRAIAGDWRGRVADYEAFMSERLAARVRESDVELIGYRRLRACLRRYRKSLAQG